MKLSFGCLSGLTHEGESIVLRLPLKCVIPGKTDTQR
ncbi:Uncharacterised protein [Vibrio cholerae]|uniref:Uncharacterized protein n=1 Tax=Vibrio cholerae TaxID=666 RepID=A0A655VRF6_VIBCL|nr:Uncharacterised protein [Vibrio cholerae]CRZ79246.1 Uncharacterised protein [Vibrio cholerae]CRZ84240.1 Uncharacterised protein [Vibrio cholerae]CRZ95513.1 Uncharacterised protein [Vibrio cholerae]CSA07050.1 Uncharacterised protein [Vibrio cholerae]